MQFTAQPAMLQCILFITNSMDDHDEEKRREENLFVRSVKSEAEVAILQTELVCVKWGTFTI